MKKKIAIWCCLAVGLGVLIYFFKYFFGIYMRAQLVDSLGVDLWLQYVIIGIVGIAFLLASAILVFFIKDTYTEEIKMKIKENIKDKKEKNKIKKIKEYEEKLKNLKEDE